MGKRSDFARNERDFYPTPLSAVLPLLRHLKPLTRFCEPCAGDGALVDHLRKAGHLCYDAWDIQPQRADIKRLDALKSSSCYIDCFITNPPWDRQILHPLIMNLCAQHPTWLLFDADWPHTKQAIPYLRFLYKIVAIGRVKWIPDSKFTGKDNCCWYLFDHNPSSPAPIEFFGRR